MSSSAVALQDRDPADAAEPAPLSVIAHKFGGSSVADATRYRHVAGLLRARGEVIQASVVSAMKGVTDALIALAHSAADGGDWRTPWQALRERHLRTADELLVEHAAATTDWLQRQFDELAE